MKEVFSGEIGKKSLFILFLLGVSLFYFYSNIAAPIERDSSLFLFIANNMAHGQAPYWAAFETKNPLMELYWVPFIQLFSTSLGIEGAARLAESFWMWGTATLIFLGASQSFKGASKREDRETLRTLWVPAVLSLLYLILALDVRVTRDGLIVSLYQSLPELGLLLLLLRDPKERPFFYGVGSGGLIFLSWFVKQTSMLTVGALVLTAAFIYWRQFSWRWVLGIIIGASLGMGLFGLHLIMTQTWENYYLGTYVYKASLIPQGVADFWMNLKKACTFMGEDFIFPFCLMKHRIWTIYITLAVMGWGGLHLFLRRREGGSGEKYCLLLGIVWMVSSLGQALGSLLFFNHYFLASLAPICFVLALLLRAAPWKVLMLGFVLLLGGEFYVIQSYMGMHSDNEKRREQDPMVIATKEILPYLRPKDRIFNWSGLGHILVAHGAPSAFPFNMYWPFIMEGLPREQRETMLKMTLSNPPDVVVAIWEDHPLSQGIKGEMMTPERLEELTGVRYRLMKVVPERTGRYGEPVQVFRRFEH